MGCVKQSIQVLRDGAGFGSLPHFRFSAVEVVLSDLQIATRAAG
jgi:hypothetical protein